MGCSNSKAKDAALPPARMRSKEEVVGRPLHETDNIDTPFGYDQDATRWTRRRSYSSEMIGGSGMGVDTSLISKDSSVIRSSSKDYPQVTRQITPLKDTTPRDSSYGSASAKKRNSRDVGVRTKSRDESFTSDAGVGQPLFQRRFTAPEIQ
mmetsp:Transcript_15974/g.39507  ORF Transcript_15974/g.39507 Transcript_15974/m.39507 type:complete len:151 (+) Transcript_15974:903-1355(+)